MAVATPFHEGAGALVLLDDEALVVEEVREFQDPLHLRGVEQRPEARADDGDHLPDGLERHLLPDLGERLLEDPGLERLLAAILDRLAGSAVG